MIRRQREAARDPRGLLLLAIALMTLAVAPHLAAAEPIVVDIHGYDRPTWDAQAAHPPSGVATARSANPRVVVSAARSGPTTEAGSLSPFSLFGLSGHDRR